MEIEENIFSKTKRKKTFKIFLDEKNLPFDDAFDHFVFVCLHCTPEAAFALHNKR